jgi:hypothetical protein
MDWIDLAKDRDQWRALVNSNEPSGAIKYWEVLATAQLAASQVGLSSMSE